MNSFIRTIAPIIVSEAKARGYKYPSAIIAQAIIESNWGRSSLAQKYHNYFGMKAGSKWRGRTVNLKTKEEYTKGKMTTITDGFRVYHNMQAGVKGYFDFISSSRYANLKSATSSYNYLERLKADGYATSSTYVNTCYQVVKNYALRQYDRTTKASDTSNYNDMIYKLALETIGGKYGNGQIRKQKLGKYYTDVQKKVNEVLRK